ncbi:hypothetical protein ACQ4PT_021054 [Festuca glaucescens]
MAKKLGKKARKFAHKHLQGGAKRSRKLRSQFNRRSLKEFPEDENEFDGDLSDSDGYLSEDPEFANFLGKWESELVSHESDEDSDEQDEMDSGDDGVDAGDKNPPSDKILTSKTISEWCQLVSKDPKAPALRNLLNAFRDACRFDSFPILNLQVSENRDFVQRKREVVSFSPNDMSSVESFLEDEKMSGNASFT